MKRLEEEIRALKVVYENLDSESNISGIKEHNLRLLNIVEQLQQENHFLRMKLKQLEQDCFWLEKRADEWMMKALQKPEQY